MENTELNLNPVFSIYTKFWTVSLFALLFLCPAINGQVANCVNRRTEYK